MHEDARTPAYAHQPCSWHNRAVEDRLDDGSSSTGYAISDTVSRDDRWLEDIDRALLAHCLDSKYHFWLGREGD